jgi:metal-sulfur cluster biosynthetic enzyme
MLVSLVDDAIKMIPGIKDTEVKVVWEPQWDPRTMASDEVKDKLGIW